MTRDEALTRAAAALDTANVHAADGGLVKADLDRAQTWMDLADRLPGGQLDRARLNAACQLLLDACAAQKWEPITVVELLTQFGDAQGFDLTGHPQ